MKQATVLFALLVATSLTAGCGHCDPAETAVYWTFTDASNRTTTSCAQAGVATIHILVNDQLQVDAFNGTTDLQCADYDVSGGAIVPAYTPHDTIQVEGYDRSGNLLYFSRGTFATNSCGLKAYDVNLTAQAGSITINLTGNWQCPSGSYVWYSLTDVTDTNNPISYIVDSQHQNATSVPCAGAITFDAMLFGSYQLDFVQIVHPTSLQPGAQFVADFQNCTPQAFTHSADDSITVPLVPATTQCRAP